MDIIKGNEHEQNAIRTIQELYRLFKTEIKIGQRLWKGLLTDIRPRQGCCIFRTLFKIYLKKSIENLKGELQ